MKLSIVTIKKEVEKVAAEVSQAQAIRIIEKQLYNSLPESNDDMLSLCDKMLAFQSWACFSIATLWMKQRKALHKMKYFPVFESWLYQYAHSWATCDALCNRMLNHIVERYKAAFNATTKWGDADNPFVRRAAAVSLIREEDNFIVYYDIEKVLLRAEKLMGDTDLYVQKGVGWLLKAASKVYLNEVLDFLKRQVSTMPRLVFRYALEKTPEPIRKEMMKL
jgi:3-methyladenine DNA glycosylase AlkD